MKKIVYEGRYQYLKSKIKKQQLYQKSNSDRWQKKEITGRNHEISSKYTKVFKKVVESLEKRNFFQ